MPDAEGTKIGADHRHHGLNGETAKRLEPLRLGNSEPAVAVTLHQRTGGVLQIVAGIKPVRHRAHRLASRFAVAEVERPRERIHLRAGVVDIVFAAHGEARFGQQRRQRVPHHGAAAVADMERTCRVGRDVLDIHPPSLPHRGIAVGTAGAENLGELRPPKRILEPQIDEAGTRNLGVRHIGQVLKSGLELIGEDARRHARGLCKNHRRVGREIAVRGIARRLDRDPRRIETGRQRARVLQRLDLGHDDTVEMREQVHQVVA
jgi:hypothetical protein